MLVHSSLHVVHEVAVEMGLVSETAVACGLTSWQSLEEIRGCTCLF
jgi:hypothetical protein